MFHSGGPKLRSHQLFCVVEASGRGETSDRREAGQFSIVGSFDVGAGGCLIRTLRLVGLPSLRQVFQVRQILVPAGSPFVQLEVLNVVSVEQSQELFEVAW
jgi:hypothetical protein